MALVYSCCFWFSLRLGGILIGIFSMDSSYLHTKLHRNWFSSFYVIIQGILLLVGSSWAYANADQLKDDFSEWIKNLNLIYSKGYFESIMNDPHKYLSLTIGITSIYIIASKVFIYGAYICNNLLMLVYIIMELLRLIVISTLVATGLLLLKQNTMDIGFLIGASVLGGFFLLGMFYLWVCAANLPILINEMLEDEQSETIDKLRQILETNRLGRDVEDVHHRGAFFITNRNQRQGFERLHRNPQLY